MLVDMGQLRSCKIFILLATQDGSINFDSGFRRSVLDSELLLCLLPSSSWGPATLTPGPPPLPLLSPFPKVSWGEGRDFLLESSAKNTWVGRPKVWIWSVLDSWSDPLSRPGHLSPVPLQLLFSLLPKGIKVSTFPQNVFSNPALESFPRVWAPMRDQVGDNPGLRRDSWGSAASHRENWGASRHPLTWADALMRAGRAIPVLRSLGSLSGFRGPNLNTFGSPEPRKWEHGLGKPLVGNICLRVPWWQSLHQHL